MSSCISKKLLRDVYSTEEVKTNKVWIDGKPIYRKVFILNGYGTLENEKKISCPIPNIETITHQEYYYLIDNIKYTNMLVETSGIALMFGYNVSSQVINVHGKGSWQNRELTFIAEYTKTTD